MLGVTRSKADMFNNCYWLCNCHFYTPLNITLQTTPILSHFFLVPFLDLPLALHFQQKLLLFVAFFRRPLIPALRLSLKVYFESD